MAHEDWRKTYISCTRRSVQPPPSVDGDTPRYDESSAIALKNEGRIREEGGRVVTARQARIRSRLRSQIESNAMFYLTGLWEATRRCRLISAIPMHPASR